MLFPHINIFFKFYWILKYNGTVRNIQEKKKSKGCLLNVTTLQSFSIKMRGISTLYLEGYFKHKYVQQVGENILHMEKKEAYYLKGSLKEISSTVISSRIYVLQKFIGTTL